MPTQDRVRLGLSRRSSGLQQSHDHLRVIAPTCNDTPSSSFAGRSKVGSAATVARRPRVTSIRRSSLSNAIARCAVPTATVWARASSATVGSWSPGWSRPARMSAEGYRRGCTPIRLIDPGCVHLEGGCAAAAVSQSAGHGAEVDACGDQLGCRVVTQRVNTSAA